MLFDVDGQSKEVIIERLKKVLGKTQKRLDIEKYEERKKVNYANFGQQFHRFCICGEPGQVPCPSFIPLPKIWRQKNHYMDEEEGEEE